MRSVLIAAALSAVGIFPAMADDPAMCLTMVEPQNRVQMCTPKTLAEIAQLRAWGWNPERDCKLDINDLAASNLCLLSLKMVGHKPPIVLRGAK
jgi:hypothetical protein